MSHFLTLKKEQFKMGNISSPLDCYRNDEIPPKPQSDGHNTAWTERGTQILAAEGWVTLTECFCQHSLRTGLFFLCTTTSCMSSRDGCWPISSSKGSMYSSTGPAEGTPVKPSLCRGGGEDCSVGNGGQNQKPAWFGLEGIYSQSSATPATAGTSPTVPGLSQFCPRPLHPWPGRAVPAGHSSPSAAVQREASSQSTSPMAYMSILRNASLWKLMAPSSTSGAMYLRVPTCKGTKTPTFVSRTNPSTGLLPNNIPALSQLKHSRACSRLRIKSWNFHPSVSEQ